MTRHKIACPASAVAFILWLPSIAAAQSLSGSDRITLLQRGTRLRQVLQVYAENGPLARGDVPALVRLLSDTSAAVRANASQALGAIGISARAAGSALLAIARDPTDRAATAAVTALGRIGDAAAVPTLLSLLGTSQSAVSEAALVALARIGPPARSAGPGIRSKLQSDSPRTRALAASALGSVFAQTTINAAHWSRLSGDSAIRPSLGTFDEPRTRALVRQEISRAGVVEPLTTALRDSMASVRSAAAAALDKILGWPIEDRDELSVRKRMVAYVDTGAFGLRGDGLGFYDAIAIGGFCLHPLECSNIVSTAVDHPKPRFIDLDLSHPVPASGATDLGRLRDYDAFFAPEWDQDSTRTVSCRATRCAFPRSILEIPVDSAVMSERVEIRFYINGRKHLLQFGPWTTGQWSRTAGASGQGTSRARIARTSWWTWTVELSPGSRGRLWDISDSQHATDLGLYEFSFRVFLEPRDLHDTMPVAW